MSGRLVMGGLILFSALFGAALWYFQVYAFYVEENGLTSISAAGEDLTVTDYRGIAASSSPLKLRACFQTAWTAEGKEIDPGDPVPLTAPHWFECFDAERISRDLQAGKATSIRAARNEPDGVDRYIALYPDGQAFMWRQLNEKFADQ
ncbi:MAG: DUF6446 family protein [Pseudomonadota bacterium]